tara:strand:+ start:543 stop:683 length:141 start_codon:yes stop_codon:yes gene_type:complete
MRLLGLIVVKINGLMGRCIASPVGEKCFYYYQKKKGRSGDGSNVYR